MPGTPVHAVATGSLGAGSSWLRSVVLTAGAGANARAIITDGLGGATVLTLAAVAGTSSQACGPVTTTDPYLVLSGLGASLDGTLNTADPDPPTASAIATAVWAAGTRTLTGLGTAVADITAAVLAGLAATIAQVAATYTKVLAPGGVHVASPGPDDAGVITVVIGDAYDEDHANAIEIPIPSAPDVSTAALAFTVEGVTFSPAVTAVVSGVGDARVATVDLSATHTIQLNALPLGFPRLNRTYWRLRATWTESPQKPQTIAYGEIRRPVWDQA